MQFYLHIVINLKTMSYWVTKIVTKICYKIYLIRGYSFNYLIDCRNAY